MTDVQSRSWYTCSPQNRGICPASALDAQAVGEEAWLSKSMQRTVHTNRTVLGHVAVGQRSIPWTTGVEVRKTSSSLSTTTISQALSISRRLGAKDVVVAVSVGAGAFHNNLPVTDVDVVVGVVQTTVVVAPTTTGYTPGVQLNQTVA